MKFYARIQQLQPAERNFIEQLNGTGPTADEEQPEPSASWDTQSGPELLAGNELCTRLFLRDPPGSH